MVEFKTLKAEAMKTGERNFIEVAKKVAVSEKGETEFISISRGFITSDGQRRYTKSVTVPTQAVEFVAEKLKGMK